MISKQKYIEYLISTPINYTCTHLSEHLDGLSHDVISHFLKHSRITLREVWEQVKDLLSDSEDACLIIDDSVQNKQYSRSIERVKRQYSGAVGGLVRYMGCCVLVHTNGKDSYPIDYRIYAHDTDGKTKNDHFKDMLINAVVNKQIKAKTVLFDSGYGSWQNLKLVNTLGLIFYTTLKNNRLVSLNKEQGYIHLDAIDWTEPRLLQGVIVKLKKVPFTVKLFKLVTTNGDIDWMILMTT